MWLAIDEFDVRTEIVGFDEPFGVWGVKSFRVLVRFGLQFEFMFGQYFSSNAEIWKLGVLGFGEGMLLIVLS